MSEPELHPPQPAPRRRRFQFGLGTMLLAAVPISILSAAWAGMMGLGAENSKLPSAFYVLLAAAAPMGVMILFSVCRAVLRALDGSHRRR